MTDSHALGDVIARTHHLLLDFDGPVCSIFAGFPAPVIAGRLRDLVHRQGAAVTDDMLATGNPLLVLRLVARGDDDELTSIVAAALRDCEVEAVETAVATPYIDTVVHAAADSGRRLAIVSNNSEEAVTAYLDRHDLASAFVSVVGRYDGMDIGRLKPSSYLLGLALERSNATAAHTALVGDETTDIEAATATDMASIGYANKPEKDALLAGAGATVLIASMLELAQALSSTVPSR